MRGYNEAGVSGREFNCGIGLTRVENKKQKKGNNLSAYILCSKIKFTPAGLVDDSFVHSIKQ